MVWKLSNNTIDQDPSLPLSQETERLLLTQIEEFMPNFLNNENQASSLDPNSANLENQAHPLDPSLEHRREICSGIQVPFTPVPSYPTEVPAFPTEVPYAKSSLPAMESWPGIYSFDVSFNTQRDAKNATWVYSAVKDKLYVKMGVPCTINFTTTGAFSDDLYIRAISYFSSPKDVSEVVHRCVNHSMDELKKGVYEAEHLIRCESNMASYHVDPVTQRHSVTVPYELPHAGQHYSSYIYKFACYGSCAGGPNRRPLMLVFSLERGGEVIGRRSIDIKICACPGRDRDQEEKVQQPTLKRPVKSELSSPNKVCKRVKKSKSQSENGPYVIQAKDKKQYKFLLTMKMYYELSKTIGWRQNFFSMTSEEETDN